MKDYMLEAERIISNIIFIHTGQRNISLAQGIFSLLWKNKGHCHYEELIATIIYWGVDESLARKIARDISEIHI